MKKIIVLAFILIVLFPMVTFAQTPGEILDEFEFGGRVTIEYVDSFDNFFTQANVTTYFGNPNSYIIRLKAVPFTEYQKGLFLHEVGHIIQYEYNVSIQKYHILMHNQCYYNTSWADNPSESLSEDFKCYFAKKYFGLYLTNTTNYDYDETRFIEVIKILGLNDIL